MENQKKDRKLLVIVIIIFSLVISFAGGFFTSYILQGSTGKKLSEVYRIIYSTAKDPNGNDLNFNTDEVTKNFVKGLLKNDDYAEYYSVEELEQITNEGLGQYSGVGVSIYESAPVVFQVVGNSPAEKAGLKAGDKIVEVGTEAVPTVAVTTTEQVINIIDDTPTDLPITFVVERGGERLSLIIKKQAYVASYVYYYDNATALKFLGENGKSPTPQFFATEKNALLDDKTALIVFQSFTGEAASQLSIALDYFYNQGKEKLILDLRGNGGGYLECMQTVASYFIYNNGEKKSLITRVEERNGYTEYFTFDNKFNSQLKNIVVLADENSASATECMLGAMLTYKDAGFGYDKLLITKNTARGNYSTYGKGIMQTTYSLISGGGLKLTTARLYWPDTTTCIQGVGIEQTITENQVTNQTALARAIEILAN